MQAGSYYSSTAVGPGGVTSFSGTVYNPGAATQAQALINMQTMSQVREAEADSTERLASFRSVLLKRHTVDPNTSYGGAVLIRPEDAGEVPEKAILVIELSAGEEVHTFRFQLTLTD